MRKVLIWVLLFLGALFLVGGLVSRFWAYPAGKVTPQDVNTTTHLAGSADKLDPTTGDVEHLPIKITNVTQTDVSKSTDTTNVWVTSTCIVEDTGDVPNCVDKNDPRLVNASTDVFASDRKTALAVNPSGLLPAGSEPHQGLVNKWPFDSEKKTYPYWDSTLLKAVPATYAGTRDIDGVETFTYKVAVEHQPAEVVQGVQGFYTNEVTLAVEPKTGAIIDQDQHTVLTQKNGDPLLDLTASFTDGQVSQFVDDANGNLDTLRLVGVIVPVVGVVLGLVLLTIGILLLIRDGRRPGAETPARQDDHAYAG